MEIVTGKILNVENRKQIISIDLKYSFKTFRTETYSFKLTTLSTRKLQNKNLIKIPLQKFHNIRPGNAENQQQYYGIASVCNNKKSYPMHNEGKNKNRSQYIYALQFNIYTSFKSVHTS